jgi:hypothetical protein
MSTMMADLQDEQGQGDPRRCLRHGTVISSPDGMFDGLCGACEAEADVPFGPPTCSRHLGQELSGLGGPDPWCAACEDEELVEVLDPGPQNWDDGEGFRDEVAF